MANGCMFKSKCGRCVGLHGTKTCTLEFVERSYAIVKECLVIMIRGKKDPKNTKK